VFRELPILTAVKSMPMKASATERGSAPEAKAAPRGIEAAIAAPGAIEVIDWKRTSARPTAFLSN